MKNPLTIILFYVVTFMLSFSILSCDTMWQVSRTKDISFSINMSDFIPQHSTIQKEQQISGRGAQEIDAQVIKISLHASSNDAVIASQTVPYSSYNDKITVVFTEVDITNNRMYASASVDLLHEGKSIYGRSDDATIIEGENYLVIKNTVETFTNYSISYVLDGGTQNSNNKKSYTYETDTFTLETPSKSNSTFLGWYTDNESAGWGQPITQITEGSLGNVTVYARWTTQENMAQITYNGSVATIPASDTGTVVIIPDTNPTTGQNITSISGLVIGSHVTYVSIGNNVNTGIGSTTFANATSVETLILGKGIKSISSSSYVSKLKPTLKSLTVHGITTLGSTFSGFAQLETLTIGDGVTTISANAFKDCTNLETVTIGDGVTTFGNTVFENCTSLKTVTIGNVLEHFEYFSAGGSPFENCTSLETVIIGDGITTLPDYLFRTNTNLQTLNVGKALTDISYAVFWHNNNTTAETSIKNVHISKENNNLLSIDGIVFSKDKTKIEYYPSGKTYTHYKIPNGVTTIGQRAFSNEKTLKTIDIPNTVTHIEGGAFYMCEYLRSVSIPDSVIEIGESAFRYCYAIRDLHLGNSLTTIGDHAFSSVASLKTLIIPPSVTTIGTSAFAYCYSLESVILPNSVTTVGSNYLATNSYSAPCSLYVEEGTLSGVYATGSSVALQYNVSLSVIKDVVLDSTKTYVISVRRTSGSIPGGTSGEAAAVPVSVVAPHREGYRFAGWDIDEDNIPEYTEADALRTHVRPFVRAYAVWEKM